MRSNNAAQGYALIFSGLAVLLFTLLNDWGSWMCTVSSYPPSSFTLLLLPSGIIPILALIGTVTMLYGALYLYINKKAEVECLS